MALRQTLETSPGPAYSPREASRYPESNSHHLIHDVYDDGYLRVEHQSYYVACDGQPIKLPRTESLIFSRLARSPERIVLAADLWESGWGKEKPLNPESLHVYIHRLRSKLAIHRVQIETMVNVGYRLLPAPPR
ncbi:MAG: two-component system, OmpR family, response regulator QseB [Blastocatellia bacterium]|jgi:DNA-binding response OmpR family regulator|nr:two-component system, OmpR family, response regulator QseB [Blastocatellia bacterium]